MSSPVRARPARRWPAPSRNRLARARGRATHACRARPRRSRWCLSRRFTQRKLELKALLARVVERQIASHGAGEGARDGQAETEALRLGAAERLEERRANGAVERRTVVANP